MDPEKRSGRPPQAPTPTATSATIRADGNPRWDPVAALRRRRAAACRLPPLECGRRDPLDPAPADPDRLVEVDYRPFSLGVREREAAGAVGRVNGFELPTRRHIDGRCRWLSDAEWDAMWRSWVVDP